jgi:predicted transcriptional regulator
MPRLTITLTDARHRALKEAAARRRKSIAAIIEESLEQTGIRDMESAAALAERETRAARAPAR